MNPAVDLREKINEANLKTVEIMMSGTPIWIGDSPAIDVVPGMTKNTILHAGPPIEWERMCNPMRQGVLGAVVFEGLAKDLDEAKEAVEAGEIILSPCHHHQAVGGMTGITSASMPVHIVKNEKYGNLAYCLPHEGSSFKALGWGTNDQETLDHIRWMRDELSPVLDKGVKASGGINIKDIISRAIQMGDEAHSRCTAGTLLVTRKLASALVLTDTPRDMLARVFEFLQKTDIFALHLFMAAGRAMVEPAKNIEYSTVVTTLCRNGVEFGIRVSALGDQWFVGPAGKIKTSYFSPQWNDDVAGRDIGDSAIMEVIGLGGLIHAAAPAHEHVLKGTFQSAVQKTEEAYTISVTEHPSWLLPTLDFRGVPFGLDIRKVVQTGNTPLIDTATPHINGGFIGSGEARAPVEAFEAALRAFSATISG